MARTRDKASLASHTPNVINTSVPRDYNRAKVRAMGRAWESECVYV